jgi:hypothetical protein
MRFKHYSIRAEQAYVDWRVKASLTRQGLNAIFDSTKCGKRHPSAMAESEVTEFLTHLARDGRVAASTQNQHVKASLTCRERL